MNFLLEYFYKIKVDNLIYNNKYYYFVYHGYDYKLYIYNNTNKDLNKLYMINQKLMKTTLTSEIILNKNGEILSLYNNQSYILLKIYSNARKEISLNEIAIVSKSLYPEKCNINWGILWENKIDYLEYLIHENGKKYPLLVDSFNYFVGLAENAITYFNSISRREDVNLVVSHKILRHMDTVETLYNPLNIIFDYAARDIAEYIKNSFFNKEINIYQELSFYLKQNYLSTIDIKLIISRLLYPSFYFELYEDILIYNVDEKIVLNIVSRTDEYEKYLANIMFFFSSKYGIDEIDWLKKRRP